MIYVALLTPMKWQIAPNGRTYDPGEDTVVYFDADSGDTHLISEFAALIIQQFAGRDVESGEIIELLSKQVDPELATEIPEAVPRIMDELAALSIVTES